MKKISAILLGIVLCMFLGACSSEGITEQKMYVYYLNADKNTLPLKCKSIPISVSNGNN